MEFCKEPTRGSIARLFPFLLLVRRNPRGGDSVADGPSGQIEERRSVVANVGGKVPARVPTHLQRCEPHSSAKQGRFEGRASQGQDFRSTVTLHPAKWIIDFGFLILDFTNRRRTVSLIRHLVESGSPQESKIQNRESPETQWLPDTSACPLLPALLRWALRGRSFEPVRSSPAPRHLILSIVNP